MSLDIWFRKDLRNLLLAIYQSALLSGAQGEFLRGYEAALTAIVLALGLKEVPELEAEEQTGWRVQNPSRHLEPKTER